MFGSVIHTCIYVHVDILGVWGFHCIFIVIVLTYNYMYMYRCVYNIVIRVQVVLVSVSSPYPLSYFQYMLAASECPSCLKG